MNSPKRSYIYLPIIFALLIVFGIYIGMRFGPSVNIRVQRNDKIESLIQYIKQRYVDTVNTTQLEDKALSALLQSLDPHSSYIPASEAKEANEQLQGNFGGIGVEFNILNDTIRIVSPIAGGPSESLGIQAGDMIVKIEGVNVAGVKVTNKTVFSKLRGEQGTKVNVSIKRRGTKQLLEYTITRGEIPIYSVDVSYMLTKQIGYIKVSRFGATTFDEYIEAFDKLKAQGMKKMILDLRGNPGGYLGTAVNLADEFLENGKEIVYTEGRSDKRKYHKATSQGEFEKEPLVILIDEGSASASEIVSGAVQDNDRGTIVGRRSFGKGLVQEPLEFKDGSSVRLTIARYYTPTGRCIQKSYKEGLDAYYNEEITRYDNGELQSADSIKFADSLKYKTPAGKIVYGGGGIMPDVFVPLDTTGHSTYLSQVSYIGLINQFAFDYADKHRAQLKTFTTAEQFIKGFNVDDKIINEFVAFAEKGGVKPREKDIQHSSSVLKNHIKALVARNILGNNGYYPIIQLNDKTLQRATEVLK